MNKEIVKKAEELVSLLISKNYTITTAESCTGGLISSSITEIAGSSKCFELSFVTYSNQKKSLILGVPANILEEKGAVSEECVLAMAEGAFLRADADISVSVSGIAGPSGGVEGKPVGTVWLGVCFKGISRARLLRLSGSRGEIREASTLEALNFCLSELRNE